ncbi:type II toxin-antitoxin system YafO family toxin [Kingella negevensis]|uniref:type II toxin-antitoxin system YafO family toxin n=1 Tax=Kingella negevensis TaxID=1522312 RepID=UPI0015DAB9BA|nr:type II toxin-antitoxin system YafO family toxin [Kingella negevensis]MDK4696635.1 type II toxin-antitoxin system YafO family toxin [Kingella negevensis]
MQRFKEWKKAESESFLFGKDGAYISPKVNGESYVLRHVHLVPLLDVEQLAKWQQNWQRGSRRTSNRALVYAQDNHRFLLIDILPEPVAHEIAQMKNEQAKKMMLLFAQIAESYIYHNEIIA